jgi:arabinan endo-1,5-alpha-L-arabinosidase
MKRKKIRALSITMAAVLTASLVTGNVSIVNAAQSSETSVETGIQITDDEMAELLAGDEDATVTTRTRQSVHDPSIVVDEDSYYVFGSHMGVAKTTDLKNWTSVDGESTTSLLFANVDGQQVSYEDAFKENAYQGKVSVAREDGTTAKLDFGSYDITKWIADNTVQGNMWAPDVIYNTTMNKWCMYLSLNGAYWDSAIILLTADDIEGPYVYQGPVVFSGFSTADSSDSFHDTDLELVLGELDELPAKYSQRTDTSNGSWGDWWPHAIDPAVFYDDDGNLWMSYGSWSGGICMLELDENTGLRDYTVVYESNSDTLGKSYTSDAYFGTRIAGGYYVSGEGSYIQKIGDYYYLFISYGFYSPEGGYNMRIFRSENPDGPYVDSEGTSALYTKYSHNYNGNDNRGERLMAGYKWDTMDEAEVAQGHNSAFVDKDGKAYVVYHTKFADGTVGHELRVHQLFVNEDGWLVAAPYEYDGETLSTNGYSVEDVAGEYDTILHSYVQNYANLDYATPLQISLNADGTITGTYTGTWSVDSDNPYINLYMDGHTYKGVLVEQKVDNENYSTLCFTAVNEEGLCIWGSMAADSKKTIALNVKNFDFGVPAATYTDITLPTEGNSGAVITWSTSNAQVLTADGKIASNITEDTKVTLTARISKGGYYYDKKFDVVVKAGDGTFDERTLIASYFIDNPQDLSDKLDGSLSVANPYYDNTTRGIDISGGVSIEFDITKTGDVHTLGTILGFMGSGRLYFTPGSYLGYNATGGYFDANIKDYGLVEDYIGDEAHVELKFTSEGFEVYVNGELAYDQSIVSTENGAASLTKYSKVLEWLNKSADTLYFGYGSWWAAAGYDEAECTISNVKCYVEPTNTSNSSSEVTYFTESYEKDYIALESTDAITYEDNPFYGKNITELEISYTLNFSESAAKNGWDGIFSFYKSSNAGRVSVQTNPYICFNDGTGNWYDLNNPSNGGQNWAASAETGKDYEVCIKIAKNSVSITIDGEEISLSEASSGTLTGEDILDFISECDQLTFGVGQAVTSYWWTELCEIKNFSAKAVCSDKTISGNTGDTEETTEAIEQISDNSWKINKDSAILYLDNPVNGQDMDKLTISYDIMFDSDAAKNGWDGLFSFYNSSTTGRVSIQSAPYICYNDMAGKWSDINQPSLDGATDWAASASTGETYHVEITITSDSVTIAIDGETISIAQNSSDTYESAQDVLDDISACDNLTIGVGLAETSFWNTELCTLSNLEITASKADTNKGEIEGETGNGTEGETEGETGNGTEGEIEGETGEGSEGETEGETENGSEGETEGETGEGSEGETEGETGDGSEGETEGETGEGSEGETGDGSEGETEGETGDGSEGETEGETGDGSEGETEGETGEGSEGEIGNETDKNTEDASKPPVNDNNDGNNNSNNNNDSSSSESSSSGSTEQEVVEIPDAPTPTAPTIPVPTVKEFIKDIFNGKCIIEEVNVAAKHILKTDYMNKYYGQSVIMSAIFGPKFGITINMSNIPETTQANDLNINYTFNQMPEFATQFDTTYAKANEIQSLPFEAYLNFNVGEENTDKTAYVYMMSEDGKSFNLEEKVKVNEIGNVSLQTERVADVVIMVEK